MDENEKRTSRTRFLKQIGVTLAAAVGAGIRRPGICYPWPMLQGLHALPRRRELHRWEVLLPLRLHRHRRFVLPNVASWVSLSRLYRVWMLSRNPIGGLR